MIDHIYSGEYVYITKQPQFALDLRSKLCIHTPRSRYLRCLEARLHRDNGGAPSGSQEDSSLENDEDSIENDELCRSCVAGFPPTSSARMLPPPTSYAHALTFIHVPLVWVYFVASVVVQTQAASTFPIAPAFQFQGWLF